MNSIMEWVRDRATEIALGAQVGATVVAALALVWGLLNFRQTSRLHHYTELDRLYFDIVSLRVGHPLLGNRRLVARLAKEQGTERALVYDSYALLIWNFIETIFDRCKQRGLLKTWKPILDHEGELHREWFARNLGKFKLSFRQWASDEIPEVGTLVGPDGKLRKPFDPPVPARPEAEAPHYDAASVCLADKLVETFAAWANEHPEIDYPDRNWRIAEALHLATWRCPHTHAPLMVLLEEERLSKSLADEAPEPSAKATFVFPAASEESRRRARGGPSGHEKLKPSE